MPSYSLRERRECLVCRKVCRGDKCEICGGKTQVVSKWSVRFNVKVNGKNVNKRLSGFDSRQDAEIACRNFFKNAGGYSGSFGDIFNEYITKISRTLKGATIYNKCNIFKLHILPYFSDYKIADITKSQILLWRGKLMELKSGKTQKEYSIKYINNIRAELCAFLNYVQEYYELPNIILNIKPLKKSSENIKEMKFYDITEFKRLLRAIRRSHNEKMRILYYTFFSTLYYTGARVGEILALSDDDIDFNSKVMNINKSLTRKTLNSDKYKITSPKNSSSIRRIRLPDKLITTLQSYIEWKRREEIYGNFLFCGESPLNSYSYTRALKKYSEIAHIKTIRIHDFRHSHASLLINLGANVALVSKRLGHTNTQQTLNTYSHLFPNSENEIIKLLNKIS